MTSSGGNCNNPMWEGLGGPVRVDASTNNNRSSMDDPTLDACCQRELDQNRQYNALTRTLQRHDVIAMAERRRKHVIQTTIGFQGCRCCYDPELDGLHDYPALQQYKLEHYHDHEGGGENKSPNLLLTEEQQHQDQQEEKRKQLDNNDDDDTDSDDEFDYLLDEDLPSSINNDYEETRRTELEYQVLVQQVALQHGYGTHRQLHPNRVAAIVGLGKSIKSSRPPPPAVVWHLYDDQSTASASLDYYLERVLSPKTPGTIFVRSEGRDTLYQLQSYHAQGIPLPPELQNPSSVMDALPCLIAVKDGVMVQVCPQLRGLTMTTSNDHSNVIEPSAVAQWLSYANVLVDRMPHLEEMCMIRPEEEALMEYLQKSKVVVEEEDIYDCGVKGCQKTFAHEHVGISNAQQSGLVVKEDVLLEVFKEEETGQEQQQEEDKEEK